MNVCVQAQLTAVLAVTCREAVRQICRVFRELYGGLVKENTALKDRVGHLESEARWKVSTDCGGQRSAAQTLYKIKPSGELNSGASQRSRVLCEGNKKFCNRNNIYKHVKPLREAILLICPTCV